MLCRHARDAIVERELDLLTPEVIEALDLHLDGCRACSAASADERQFVSGMAALRGEIPFELDVTPRVMFHVSTRWLHSIPEVTTRQLGWCAAVAVAAAIALAVTGWGIVPGLEPVARGIGSLTAGLFGLAERLGGTFAMLVMMTTIAYFVGRDWVGLGSATEARRETR